MRRALLLTLLSFSAACPSAGVNGTVVIVSSADTLSSLESTQLVFRSDKGGSYVVSATSTDASPVTLARGEIAPGAEARVTVAGSRLRVGANEIAVLVYAASGRPGRATKTITVSEGGADLHVTGESDFGVLFIPSTASRTLTVANQGTLPATLGALSPGPQGTPYRTIVGSCAPSSVLAPGQSCTLTAIFAPVTAAALPGEISLAYDDATGSKIARYLLNGSGQCPSSTSSAVVPQYSTAAAWNAYVRSGDKTTPCNGSETNGPLGCIHGGERRKVVLTGTTSCAGLTAADALGAFEWQCNAISETNAFFFSTRLRQDKGLADLIAATGDGFRANSVTVTHAESGCVIASTAPASWWTNPVQTLGGAAGGTGIVSLSTAGTIYTVPTSTAVGGVNLSNDAVALVTLNSAVLGFHAGAPLNYEGSRALVFSDGGDDFLWLEGRLNGAAAGSTNAAQLVDLVGTRFARVHHVDARMSDEHGIRLRQVTNSTFSQVAVSLTGIAAPSGARDAFSVWSDSPNNRFVDIVAADSLEPNNGVVVFSAHNVLHRVTLANNFRQALILASCCGGAQNVITKLAIQSGNAGGAASDVVADSPNNTIAFATVANVSGGGVSLFGNGNTLAQAVVVNGGENGVEAQGSGGKLARLAVAHVAGIGFHLLGSNIAVSGGLWVGDTMGAACVSNGTNALDAACNYGAVPPTTPPTTTQLSLATAIVGRAPTDSKNPSAPAGTAVAGGTTDFVHFESFLRGFGRSDAGAFPQASQRGRCFHGETCQVWDLSLSTASSAIKNAGGQFVAGAACPSLVDASASRNVLTDNNTPPNVFLVGAEEIVDDFAENGDRVGDDDGLCESNEACAYAPNVGAYQGHGDPKPGGTCLFTGGNGVTAVQMYAYPINGR